MSKKRDTESTFVPTEGTPTATVIDGAVATMVVEDGTQILAASAVPAPVVNETPPVLHRETARRASRLASKVSGDAGLAEVETTRRGLLDAAVLYVPRVGEAGYAAPPAASAHLAGRVTVAHNADCADIECVVGYDGEGEPIVSAVASCILAGARDTKVGDPGTFEVIG